MGTLGGICRIFLQSSVVNTSAPLRHLPHPCCCANLFPCLENDPQAIRTPFRPLSQFYYRSHQFSPRQALDPASSPCFHCEQCYHFLLSEWSNHHPVVETCHLLPTERIMKSEPLGTQGEETLALLLGLSSQFLLHSQPRSLFLFHSQLCNGLGFLSGSQTRHTHCGYQGSYTYRFSFLGHSYLRPSQVWLHCIA